MKRDFVMIDDFQIVRGGAWNRHAVCEIPDALLAELAASPDRWTAQLAKNESAIRQQDRDRQTRKPVDLSEVTK